MFYYIEIPRAIFKGSRRVTLERDNQIWLFWLIEEGGGRCLQGNLWHSPPTSMTSRLVSVTFKMASKVISEETDKYFDFISQILFRFLGFGDFKVSIVIENYFLE